MSSELYVQGFSHGKPAGLPLALILEMLNPKAHMESSGHYLLDYDPLDSCEVSVGDDSGRAVAITVFRPCADARLYDSLFEILRSGPYVAYSPGSPPVVADQAVAD